MDQKNLIIELRRRVNALETQQNVFVDVEPKNPKTSTVWVRSNGETKYWDGQNWVIGGGGALTDWNTTVAFTASDYRTIAWSTGVVSIGTRDSKIDYATTSGNFTMTQTTYFYWQADNPTAIQTATVAGDVVIAGGVLLAVGRLNPDTANKASLKAFGGPTVDQIIADEIVANSITANMIQANSITSAKLATTLLYAGSIVLNTNGLIRGGQTAFNTGTGFFLGYSGAAYKFSIGNPSTNYMSYDGTDMIMNGGTVRTGLTGQRIELSGNNFKSYDSSNVLRIQTANEGMRITDSTGSYNADLSTRSFSGPGAVEWPYLLVGDTTGPYARVGLRTSFLAGHPTATDATLRLYLASGSITFRSIGGGGTSGTGVTLTSPDDDTLTFDGKKISFNGIILEKIGSDLYWNGEKIN